MNQTLHPRETDQLTARVHRSSAGESFTVLHLGDLTIHVPGENHDAITTAQAWAAQLLSAAEIVREQMAVGAGQ